MKGTSISPSFSSLVVTAMGGLVLGNVGGEVGYSSLDVVDETEELEMLRLLTSLFCCSGRR